MQHHPHHRPPGPLAPVHPAARRRPDLAMRLQGQAHPVVAALDVVLGHQLLPEVPGGVIPVARVEQLQHRHHLVGAGAPRRHPPQPAVVQSLRPVDLVPVAPAPERPLRHPQHLRRLHLAQLAAITTSVNLLELHQPESL